MKPTVFFALVLVAASTTSTGASANPRGLGPSAIKAARLKVRPPANYLAHYLPDDRYKIAGGVWKYVSTDLDTYYHLPQSGNMMRQPASRVIGFANSRDAEEAGYVADPSDGTASHVAAATQDLGVEPGTVRDAETDRYIAQVTPLLEQSNKNEREFLTKLAGVRGQISLGPQGIVTPAFRQVLTNQLRTGREFVKRLSTLRPPARFRKFHSMLRDDFRLGNMMVGSFDKMVSTGDFGQLQQINIQAARAETLQRALVQEGKRQGITYKTF